MSLKRVPKEGVIGETALREAAATELNAVMSLVRAAVRAKIESLASAVNGGGCEQSPCRYVDTVAYYPDRVVVFSEGRLFAYPYTLTDANVVIVGDPVEVVLEHKAVAAGTPAPDPAPIDDVMLESARPLTSGWFIEAKTEDGEDKPSRYVVRVIRSGTSINGVNYPVAVLREAAPLFAGVRVFVKGDEEHVKGAGKDFRQLVGRLTSPTFVEAAGGGGEIHAVLEVLESSDVAAKLREAVERGMTDLFGLSIDASGAARKRGKFREATSITKVASVDLIIEPGAGGQVIRFAEAHQETDMLRQQMIDEIKKVNPSRAEALESASDGEVLTAYREAVGGRGGDTPAASAAGVTADQLDEKVRMVEARAYARATIRQAQLPAAVRERLAADFEKRERFVEADVDAAMQAEREFLGKLSEDGKVRGLGSFVEAGEDRSEKVTRMFDDFFDPSKPARSFREAYVEVTGDRDVTGVYRNCDRQRLVEAAGARFAEAVSAGTFSDILGDSITRAMVREYNAAENYRDWRDLVDVVPVSNFRTQQRTRMGGYGNLPAVAENGSYDPLTTPGDEKAEYALTKRGGTETVSLEAISNDDVGVIRRIPLKLGTAAARTLYEFVLDFMAANPLIYDGLALFVAGHSNLGVAGLDAASYAAARLRMKKQTEADSAKALGLLLRHLYVPAELEEAAFDLFVRGTNNDETFVQSRKPKVHVVDYWADANNWFGTADRSEVELIELGFYAGNEEPELFVQDNPTQGSLFSNDQIKYKIRHAYSGAVIDYRGFDGNIVA